MARLSALILCALMGQVLSDSFSNSDRNNFPLTGGGSRGDSRNNFGRDTFPLTGSSSNFNSGSSSFSGSNRDSSFGSSSSSSSNNRDSFPLTGSRGSSGSNRDFAGSSNSGGSDWDADNDDDLFSRGSSGSGVSTSSANRINAWTDGIIPYEITSDISDTDANALKRMFSGLQAKTCVRFVPHRNEANYVVITGGSGCSAPLGMKLSSTGGRGNMGGAAQVKLAKGCFTTQRVARRIMNLLGIPHEASRPDRDRYVQINFDNLRTGYASQLKMYPASAYLPGVLDLPYDYQSVTQYADADIAKDTRNWSIRPKDSRMSASQLGGNDFSSGDIQKIQRAYRCR